MCSPLCPAGNASHRETYFPPHDVPAGPRIQNQFGAFCAKVLKNEARNICREYAHLHDREKSLDGMTATELEQTATVDRYFEGEHTFDVLGIPVVVCGDTLAGALARLPEAKRTVILLTYFLGMTDREIGRRLYVTHQTVSKRRLTALKELRGYMTEEGTVWPDEQRPSRCP